MAFMVFCRNLGVVRIFLNWNQAEADQLRSWFKLACLYYSTHYHFKVDAQAFDLVMEPPRYLHIPRADKTGSLVSFRGSSRSRQQWRRRSHPGLVTVVPSFVRMGSLETNSPSLWWSKFP